ncbi:hypothetical protein NC652_030914 [Populus alba x Populus x berolinensis]|nr:hypothetical protein NC652_030914 [Populus alba x Populus x berolinensis]
MDCCDNQMSSASYSSSVEKGLTALPTNTPGIPCHGRAGLESATKALESNCDKDIHDSIINCSGDITATLQVHDSLICNDRGSRHQKLYLPAF